MADVLSQAEIDSLLSAMSSGEMSTEIVNNKDERKVKPYDFKRPQKFSKEHLRTLERMHDNFSRTVSNYLSTELRKNVKVQIKSVEQTSYQEFINSIPNPTVMSLFKMPPLKGSIMVEINSDFSYQILELLLGGSGNRNNQRNSKEFTEIEKNIIAGIISGFSVYLEDTWKSIVEVKPEFERLETNPVANQILAPAEPVALLTFSVEFGKSEAYINICIPYISIEKYIGNLIIEYWFKRDREDEDQINHDMEQTVKPVTIETVAELGKTNLTVNEFLDLTVGDVVKLEQTISEPSIIKIGGLPCYYCKVGRKSKKLVVQIVDCVKKGGNE